MDRLISKKKVLDVINEAIRLGRFYSGKEQTITEIEAIPSVDIDALIDVADAVGYRRGYKEAQMAISSVEPKTGHWIRKTKVDGVYDIAGVKTWGVKCQCDKCDFTTIVIEDFGYYKYCPKCGARMIELQENEVDNG